LIAFGQRRRWLDGIVALMIACWAVIEGLRAWSGRACTCAAQPAGTAELIH